MAKKPITIKKGGKTAKTMMKKKVAPVAVAPVATAPEAAEPADAALIAAAPVAGAKKKGNPYTWAAIVGVIASICYIVLITLQVLEYTYYDQPPGAFPIFVPSAAPAAESISATDSDDDNMKETVEEPEEKADEEEEASTEEDNDEEAADLDDVDV